jgi:hypothetical protein
MSESIEWINEREVGRLTGRSHRTVQAWRNTRVGPPYHKVEGTIRYNKAEVLAWWNAGRRAA